MNDTAVVVSQSGGLVERRRVRSIVASSCLLLAVASCVIVDPGVELPTPNGYAQGALVMCAVCLDRPFCFNMDTNAFEERSSATAPCVAPLVGSVAATAVATATSRTGEFHCLREAGKNYAPSAVECPNSGAEREAISEVNPCVDIPRECRIDPPTVRPADRRFAECAEKPRSTDPACQVSDQYFGTHRFACGEYTGNPTAAINKAREKLIDRAAAWGKTLPSLKPSRFCWASCAGGYPCSSPASSADRFDCNSWCDPVAFDPPEIIPEATRATVIEAESFAQVIVVVGDKGFAGLTRVSGGFAIDVPDHCRGPLPSGKTISCDVRLSYLNVGSSGSFTIAEKSVQRMELSVPAPIMGTAFTVGSSTLFSFPPGAQLYASAEIQGLGARAKLYTTDVGIAGGIDWTTRQIGILTTADDGAGASTLTLVTSGTIRNLPPVANAGPEQTVECTSATGTTVTLSAADTRDPDGAGDIASYRWSWVHDAQVFAANGPSFTTVLPVGTTPFSVSVFDRAGALGIAGTNITVRDTTPPILTVPATSFFEVCDPSGAVVDIGESVVSDACSQSVALDVRVVDVNGTAVNEPFISGYKFRQGETTLEYTATDSNGLQTRARQVVMLDRGASCCPSSHKVLIGTSGVDTLAGGNQRQCIVSLGGNDAVSGGNSGDMLICGAGNDSCHGGNGSDVVFGGVGDDVIDASNGKDGAMWGGPGDDTLIGGNGKDVFRGGAGRDAMYGGNGDDVFVIAAACEARAGEIIDGGEGNDQIESPLTREQLESRGVILRSIESVVVTAPRDDAECPDK